MDKKNNKERKTYKKGIKQVSNDEEYGYDFIPSLNEWLNIDEQKENVKRIQDIGKKN